MQRDDRLAEEYSDDTQNAGICAQEHDGSLMTRADRLAFGLNDAVLRRREELSRLRDENQFESEREN